MRKRLLTLTVIALAFLVGAGVGAGGLWLIAQRNTELRYYLLERSTVNQPQAQVAEFAQAIAQGERRTAVALWEIESPEAQSELATRRETIVSDLIEAGVDPEYRILQVEWWTTCCEPTVMCDSRSAGGARIAVQFLDENGQRLRYTFDVFAREQPYWGSAAGYPPREWVIRDVYPVGEEPLFWRRVYEPQVRYVQP